MKSCYPLTLCLWTAKSCGLTFTSVTKTDTSFLKHIRQGSLPDGIMTTDTAAHARTRQSPQRQKGRCAALTVEERSIPGSFRETLEETVAREVMEEVGLKVKNIRYYKSQPWGIVDDLLAGFYCDVDGSTDITLDRNELKEAVWVERKDVEGQPHDLSLTNEMMVVFREGREPLGYRYAMRE